MSADRKMSSRALTNELKKLGEQAHTVLPDGTPLTRDEALADLIWKQALGWTEVIEDRDDKGTLVRKEVKHPPVAWAQQYIVERREGKAPQAVQEEHAGIKAADKVRDLAKQRLNKLALAAAGPPKPKKKETHELPPREGA